MIAEKHPREEQRLATLARYGILDTSPEHAFDSLVAAASDFFEVPTALVSLVDSHRQWFKARVNMRLDGTPIEQSFCAHAILSSEIMVVDDPASDPRFADNPLVLANEGIRFYAGAPLLADDGLPLGTLCLIDYQPRQFTERDRRRLRWLADQVMQLLEMHRLRVEAERSNDFKSRFLAAVSHEIRTPLSAIVGYADLLGAELNESRQLEYVEGISRNSEHLHAIVDDLLNITRIEIGALELRPGPVDLESLLRDIHLQMNSRAMDMSLCWQVLCPEPVPETIDTDEVRLRQILINLVGNAMKRTREGGSVQLIVHESAGPLDDADAVTIGSATPVVPHRLQPLRAIGADTDTRWLHFSVCDTGDGLEIGAVHTLFEPFTRNEPVGESATADAGLGLPIARRLAELLGGVMRVASAPGEGSRFIVSLAIGGETSDRSDDSASSTGAGNIVRRRLDLEAPVHVQGRTTEPRLEGRTLLVVDDYPDILQFLQHTLEREGATVLTSANGDDALGIIAANPHIDAVLLDIELPDISGLDVAQRLRREGRIMPILALTASAMPGQKEKCLAAGCNVFLSKPVVPDRLIGLLSRQIRLAEERQRPGGAEKQGGPTVSSRPMRHKVLVVDDHRDSANVVARVLGRKGCDTFTANDSATALALAGQHMPDLVILDWQLEDTTAPELLGRFRAIPGTAHTRYVALTGWVIDRDEAAELGFSRVLQKPVGISQLNALLEALGMDKPTLT